MGQGLRLDQELGGPRGRVALGWQGVWWPTLRATPLQISSKRSSSFKRAIANGQRALPRDGLLEEPGLGVYKRFVRYVAYEILPREVDRHWYFYRHRSCPTPRVHGLSHSCPGVPTCLPPSCRPQAWPRLALTLPP